MADQLGPITPEQSAGEREPSHERLEVLDGVRGLASLTVVIFHSLFWFTSIHLVAGFFRNGEGAVEIFFVLSGYVLTVAYGERVGRTGWWRYARRRVARLYPLHVFCFGLALLTFVWWKAGPHIGSLHHIARPRYFIDHEILPQITLTQSLGTNPLAWNFPSWSLSAELWASLILGVIFIARGNIRRLLLVIGAIASFLLLYRSSTTLYYTYTVWRGLFPICLGSLAASIPAKVRTPAWLSTIALVLTPLLMVWTHDGHFMSAVGHHELAFPVWCAFFVFCIARCTTGPAIWLLETAPVRELGRRSYSIYLLHGPLLLAVIITGYMLPAHLERRWFTGATGLLVWLVFIGFTIWVSGYTVRFIEKAWQTRLRRWLRVA